MLADAASRPTAVSASSRTGLRAGSHAESTRTHASAGRIARDATDHRGRSLTSDGARARDRHDRRQLEWTDLDRRAVDTVRVLAMDAVQKVGNGHPGTAMSLAPAAYLLFQRSCGTTRPTRTGPGRDRFVLSAGHSSLTLYIQLYLSGYGLELDDLKALRTWGSLTPGHPEHGHTAGVETTTGPLGQGVGNAVGMAMAARRERGLLDPDAARGREPVRPHDLVHRLRRRHRGGRLRRGLLARRPRSSSATSSLLYDDNHISIEDDTDIAFVRGRRWRGTRRYGWHVQHVDWLTDSGDVRRGRRRRCTRRSTPPGPRPTGRRSSRLRTIIALAGAERAEHRQGARLRARRRRGRRHQEAPRLRPGRRPSRSPTRCSRTPARSSTAAAPRTPSGTQTFDAWARGQPRAHGRCSTGCRPRDAARGLGRRRCRFEPTARAIATRKASGDGPRRPRRRCCPSCGAARPTSPSRNNTTTEGRAVVPADDRQTKEFPGDPYGRVLHFGIREHAMGSILNGIALHGGTRPTAAPSWSSATTCARRSGWRR